MCDELPWMTEGAQPLFGVVTDGHGPMFCEAFRLTREDVEITAKYWYEESCCLWELEKEWGSLVLNNGTVHYHANRWLDHVARAFGAEAASKLEREVHESFLKKCAPER